MTTTPETCQKWDGDPLVDGQMMVCGLPRPCPKHGTVPVDPARWTVDDNSDPTFGDTDITVSLLSSIPRGSRVRRNAFAALVADVRAARVHEGCTHTTDTLQQEVYRLLSFISEMSSELERPTSSITGTEDGWTAFASDWVERATDILAAEGPDHE